MLTPALADGRWRLSLRRSQRPEALLRSLGCRWWCALARSRWNRGRRV